jgi:hypothetical protein
VIKTLDEHLNQISQTSQKTKTEFFNLLTLLPFWIEDKEEHKRLYDLSFYKGQKGYCCFTHSIGLPLKPGVGRLPWFPYQIEFLKAKSNNKYLRVIKATGLGFSEVELYYIAYLAIQHFANHDKPAQIPIITGPNIDIAQQLIDRLIAILTTRHPQLLEDIEKTKTTIDIGNVQIKAFPSHHIDAVRALPNPIYIFLDECDFFVYGYEDVNNPIKIVERYIAKSDPWIILVSTPNMPGGLFDRMDRDQNSRYKTFRFNYEVGMGLIYDIAQIENAKKSASFEREFNLKYGYGTGNIFNEAWIGLALLKGERLRSIPVSRHTSKSMGIDPSWGSSKFGITKIEHIKYAQDESFNNTKRVYYSKGFEREHYETMVDLCYNFIKNDGINYIFIDGSQVEFIRSLKSRIGEDINFEALVERAKKFNTPLHNYMNIIPVLNQVSGKKLVDAGKHWMGQSKTIAIDEQEAPELISQMRSAKQKDNGMLDKTSTEMKTVSFDELESFLYALEYFVYT